MPMKVSPKLMCRMIRALCARFEKGKNVGRFDVFWFPVGLVWYRISCAGAVSELLLARMRMRDIIMRRERVGIGKLTSWHVNKLTSGLTKRDNQVSVFILFPSFFLKSVLFCLSFPFFFNKIVRFSCKLSFISLPLQNKVFRLHGAR